MAFWLKSMVFSLFPTIYCFATLLAVANIAKVEKYLNVLFKKLQCISTPSIQTEISSVLLIVSYSKSSVSSGYPKLIASLYFFLYKSCPVYLPGQGAGMLIYHPME